MANVLNYNIFVFQSSVIVTRAPTPVKAFRPYNHFLAQRTISDFYKGGGAVGVQEFFVVVVVVVVYCSKVGKVEYISRNFLSSLRNAPTVYKKFLFFYCCNHSFGIFFEDQGHFFVVVVVVVLRYD